MLVYQLDIDNCALVAGTQLHLAFGFANIRKDALTNRIKEKQNISLNIRIPGALSFSPPMHLANQIGEDPICRTTHASANNKSKPY